MDVLNSWKDKGEYHNQFSARFKTKDFRKDDVNPYLSKAPRKNKIIEMLVASTPIRMLQTRFATLPAAGSPIDYKNVNDNDNTTFKKHYDIHKKDVAPRLMQPSGIDHNLLKSLEQSVSLHKKAKTFKL